MKMSSIFAGLTILLTFGVSSSQSATLAVPGTYPTIASAVAAADSGDMITIKAGEYSAGIVATISDNNITLRGEGGRAHLNANGVSISNGKAIFVTTGNNITIENIEFSRAEVPDQNGAGIRHEGGLLTVKNCYFHDNENGILTSNQGVSGELVVENSEFDHNGLGSAGYTHNIYVGRIGKFTFRSSYSHHATHGHNIKSRAEVNHILYSRIMDETDGNASYQIDLPNGGLSFIIGNSIHQGVNAENSRMISYGAEGATNPVQEIYLSGNTFVNDRHSGYGIRLTGSPVAVIRNNIFDNLSSAVEGSATSFTNNLVGSSSGFMNRTGFDYHLTSTSPARDQGGNPGSFHGVSLKPAKEYVHPLQSKDRFEDATLDIGAFEFGSGSNGSGQTHTLPFLLLLTNDNHTGAEYVPVINTVNNDQIMQGNTYTFTPTLSQGQNVKWYKAYGPDDVSINDSNGTVSWNIPDTLPGEAFYMGVKACNDSGCDTETWIIKVGDENFVYIDPNLSSGNNDGTSWENAYRSVISGTTAAGTQSGDTIIIKNGEYADANNRIYNDPGTRGSVPPSGTITAYTTIMAETPGGVLFDGENTRRPIRLKGSHDTGRGSTSPGGIDVSYIAIKGFVAGRSSAAGPIGLSSVHHVKLMYCGAYDQAADSGAIIGIGYSSNVLVESCYAYGHGRELIAGFMSDHIIFRRCIGRMDRSTSSEPLGGFVHYSNRNGITANCIVIDSDQPQYFENFTNQAGSFCNDCGGYCYYDWGQIQDILTTHSLSLNNYGKFIAKSYSQGNASAEAPIFRNNVGWDIKGWYNNEAQSAMSNVVLSRGDIIIDQHTFGALTSPPASMGFFFNSWQDDSAAGDIMTNSIIYDVKDYNDIPGRLFYDWETVDYNNIYDTGDINAYSTVNTNTITTNPRSNGLEYIVRIESGSSLQTAGQGGARVGADLSYMYGKSGTMWGEPGYNEETTTPMWPFPAEDLVKEKMAAYSYDNGNLSGARGFAAEADNPGTPNGKRTLTSYVWEYLGHTIPCEIYGRCSRSE